jgi:hypothetical protein
VRLAHAGHDVMVIHLLDEDELTFPFEGNMRFVGLEAAGTVMGEPRTLRDGYIEAIKGFILRTKRGCMQNRIDYTAVNTADNLGAVLANVLTKRAAYGKRSSSKRK